LCRYRDDYFETGTRTGRRVSFFCFAKRKKPKKRRPECRLLPAFLSFDGVCRKGLPVPPATCGIPAAPRTGYSRQNLRYSARHTGMGGLFNPLLLIQFIGCAEQCEAHQSRTMRLVPRHILWHYNLSVVRGCITFR